MVEGGFDPEALKTIRETYAGLGDDETLVEIPAELRHFAEQQDGPRASAAPSATFRGPASRSAG